MTAHAGLVPADCSMEHLLVALTDTRVHTVSSPACLAHCCYAMRYVPLSAKLTKREVLAMCGMPQVWQSCPCMAYLARPSHTQQGKRGWQARPAYLLCCVLVLLHWLTNGHCPGCTVHELLVIAGYILHCICSFESVIRTGGYEWHQNDATVKISPVL